MTILVLTHHWLQLNAQALVSSDTSNSGTAVESRYLRCCHGVLPFDSLLLLLLLLVMMMTPRFPQVFLFCN
jgi:hypothetical protein